MLVIDRIVYCIVTQQILLVEKCSHFYQHCYDRCVSSDTGPNQRSLSRRINRINNKFVLYIVPPHLSVLPRLNSLKNNLPKSVRLIAKKFLLKYILHSQLVFPQLLDNNLNVFPKKIGVVPEPHLFIHLCHFLFVLDRRWLVSCFVSDQSGLILLPDMLKLILLQLINSIELLLILVQIKISMSVVVLHKIFVYVLYVLH